MPPEKRSEPTPAELAGIRWYGLTLERLALQYCIGHPTQFHQVHAVLKRCVDELHALTKNTVAYEEAICQPPWVLCGDVCVMNCPPDGGPAA